MKIDLYAFIIGRLAQEGLPLIYYKNYYEFIKIYGLSMLSALSQLDPVTAVVILLALHRKVGWQTLFISFAYP